MKKPIQTKTPPAVEEASGARRAETEYEPDASESLDEPLEQANICVDQVRAANRV